MLPPFHLLKYKPVVCLCLGLAGVVSGLQSNAPEESARPRPAVLPGLDVLRETGGTLLGAKRLGLVANHTGKTIDGSSALQGAG
jgi:hypothetical protein